MMNPYLESPGSCLCEVCAISRARLNSSCHCLDVRLIFTNLTSGCCARRGDAFRSITGEKFIAQLLSDARFSGILSGLQYPIRDFWILRICKNRAEKESPERVKRGLVLWGEGLSWRSGGSEGGCKLPAGNNRLTKSVTVLVTNC